VLQSLVFLIHSTLAVNLHEIKIGCASRFLTAQIVIAADVCHSIMLTHTRVVLFPIVSAVWMFAGPMNAMVRLILAALASVESWMP
jgi:hypothetical protein